MHEASPDERSTRSTLSKLPRTVWALGVVSLLMDTSSELIHSLLPVFLVSTLGASAMTLGVIEGVAESTALITKIFSGVLSDAVGRRKPLALAGYGLAFVTKPLFALATSVHWVFAARFVDRIGKGIRGAPRDALVSDVTPRELRGAAYGLRQALDTVGAFAGPLLAMLCLFLFSDQLRPVFWVAVIPAAASVATLAFAVREKPHEQSPRHRGSPIHWPALRNLPVRYWWVVAIGGMFALARFSEAFLVLRSESIGTPLVEVPLVMVVMNGSYALSAYPSGHLADHVDRRKLLGAGLIVLVIADFSLAAAGPRSMLYIGATLWGLHMGLTQGLLAAMVADASPAHVRGTAFGIFNLISGIAMLIASTMAGALWTYGGPALAFGAGAVPAIASLLVLVGASRRKPRDGPST